jgi:hypothetical protein
MNTPQRPIIGAEVGPPKEPHASQTTTSEVLIARALPPWDLLPSDLLVVRRRPVKK